MLLGNPLFFFHASVLFFFFLSTIQTYRLTTFRFICLRLVCADIVITPPPAPIIFNTLSTVTWSRTSPTTDPVSFLLALISPDGSSLSAPFTVGWVQVGLGDEEGGVEVLFNILG
jgi:hypothetical protein